MCARGRTTDRTRRWRARRTIVNRRHTLRVGQAGMATETDGTGPFRLAEWRRGDQIVMERFAGCYGDSPDTPPTGPAEVDRVIFRVTGADAAAAAA